MKAKIILIAGALAIVSCKKEKVEGPTGPQGPAGANGSAASGSITGKVKQYDQYGVLYSTGLNTTTVSIDGTNLSAVTDASGNFTIASVPTGIYDLSVSRPNSGTKKYQQTSFTGNGKLFVAMDMSDKATFSFTEGYVKDTTISGNNMMKISLKYPSGSKQKMGLILYGKTSAIDPANPETYAASTQMYLSPNTTSLVNTWSYQGLDSYFSSGNIIYVKVYPNTAYYGNYYDYYTDMAVFPSSGTPLPQTFTLTMP